MKFKGKVIKGVQVVALSGDIISLNDSKELLETIDTYLVDGVKNLVLELEEVKYINSAGINVLITILTSVRNKGGELVLASISEKVKSLLVITKLNSIFNVRESIDESLELLEELAILETQQEDKSI